MVGSADFNGDGRADILWRSNSGALGTWSGTAAGGFSINDGAALIPVDQSWHVVATADFNGDGRGDILWRNDAGSVGNWLGTASGNFAPNDASLSTAISSSWDIQGTLLI